MSLLLPTAFNGWHSMALTVSEIADRVAKGSAAKRALIRRLRHWTKEGLLRPTGKKHPGTGSHRTYEDWVVEDAVLLNAMAELGLPIDTMRAALVQAQMKRTEWGKAKVKGGNRFFLQIDLPGAPGLPARVHFGDSAEAFIGLVGFETSIVFDLAQLFARLEQPKGG